MDDDHHSAAAETTKAESKTRGNCSKRRQDNDKVEEEEVWETLNKSFRQVQSVLDQNRALIQQANLNHQSRIHRNLVKNVDLIRQINGNISKVFFLYSDLSHNFASVVHRAPIKRTKSDGDKADTAGNSTL